MEDALGDISGLVGVGDYVLKEKIGEGPFSIVWKASQRRSREEVAVKQVILSKLNRSLKHCLDCELNFLASVNHPNIIRLIDAFQVYNHLSNLFVMPTSSLCIFSPSGFGLPYVKLMCRGCILSSYSALIELSIS